jgi:hypothetical protein
MERPRPVMPFVLVTMVGAAFPSTFRKESADTPSFSFNTGRGQERRNPDSARL